jgi:hypothetical protein
MKRPFTIIKKLLLTILKKWWDAPVSLVGTAPWWWGIVMAILIALWFLTQVLSSHAATFAYSYDSLNRLTNAAYSDGSREAYSYDTAGNRQIRVTTRPLPPTIIIQPRDRTNDATSSLILNVTAMGDAPLFYQWQKAGQPIAGATDRLFVITNVQPNNAGTYRVVVSNIAAAVTSSDAILTVDPLVPPAVLSELVINPANGHNYTLLGPSTWVAAETAAVSLGGHLATVRSQVENDWIYNTFSRYAGISRHLWVGLYDTNPLVNSTNLAARRLEFAWISGEPMNYSNWDPGEPNNWQEIGEFYGHIIAPDWGPSASLWNDTWDTDINTGSPMCGVVESLLTPTVAAPTITPTGGTFNGSVQVTLACATTGATIRYTLDGNDPTANSSPYSGPFTLATSLTVKAKAFKSGYNDSSVTSASFAINPGELPELAGMSFSNGIFRFLLIGLPGTNYVVQVSSNLVNWLPFSTNTMPLNGSLLITDPAAAGNDQRFYRLRSDSCSPTNIAITQTGDLVIARVGHTATLLEDGRVLVTGGHSNNVSTIFSSAELYDPVTRTFSFTTAPMSAPRWGQSAIRLNNGKVLIVGGWVANYTVPTNGAEIYDPGTGAFTLTGRMSSPRADSPALIKRSDGRVLVIGGTVAGSLGTATASIELYDPGLGSFSTIGNLALSRRDHAASLLPDNNALVIGGLYDCCNTSSNDLRRFSGELFNLTNNTSTLLASHLNIPRARIPETALLNDGRCLIIGGGQGTELYNPASLSFSLVSDNLNHDHATVLLNSLVLVSGGTGLQSFDPAVGAYTSLTAPFDQSGHTATRLADGSVLLTGGTTNGLVTKRAFVVRVEEQCP